MNYTNNANNINIKNKNKIINSSIFNMFNKNKPISTK